MAAHAYACPTLALSKPHLPHEALNLGRATGNDGILWVLIDQVVLATRIWAFEKLLSRGTFLLSHKTILKVKSNDAFRLQKSQRRAFYPPFGWLVMHTIRLNAAGWTVSAASRAWALDGLHNESKWRCKEPACACGHDEA